MPVPEGLESLNGLFEVLRERLRLPDYIGTNLDALSEVLRNLHWVEQASVVLLHDGVIFKDVTLFDVYLSILKECVDDWERGQVGRLIVVVFPAKLNERVSQLREQLI